MSNDAKIKWNDVRREQFTGATTLLFGLASGGIVFCASLLTEDRAKFGGSATDLYFWTIGGFILSLVAGFLLTISRLEDFRATSRIVSIRSLTDDKSKEETSQLRKRAKVLSTLSWWLFYIQLCGFTLGAVIMVFTLWHLFHGVLYPLQKP